MKMNTILFHQKLHFLFVYASRQGRGGETCEAGQPSHRSDQTPSTLGPAVQHVHLHGPRAGRANHHKLRGAEDFP